MRENTSMFPIPGDSVSHGVSHLQWLAGMAMQSLIMRLEGVPDSEAKREEIALWSYRMAQAMKRMENRIHVHETEVQK